MQIHIALLTVAVASLPACNKKNSGSGEGASFGATGCVQGVVVDGLAETRVALPTPGDKGVHVLVRGELLAATPATSDATKEPLLAGEYSLCGIPVDEDFPLLVWLDGYQPFESTVRVHSTSPSRSPAATADIPRPEPVELANVRVYPQNQQVKDLDVLVTASAAPVAGATVALHPLGSNFLDPSGTTFLAPTDARLGALTATTDNTGTAVFHAADLVLGGHYTYTVVPPNGGTNQSAVAAAAFVLGLRDSTDTTEPYQINVDLNQAVGPLAIISKSTEAQDPDPTGKLVVFFNREIEVVPGTADGELAVLSGNVTAQLNNDIPGNNQADTLTLTIDSNKLTVTPVFHTNPDPDPTKEIDLAVAYSGIVVRPKSSPETDVTVTVADTVSFYK